MISRTWVLGLVLLALAGVARAEEAEAVKSNLGKVQGTYARLARGVFVQTNTIPAHLRQTAEIWVDVRFTGEIAGGRDWVLAQASGAARVETGDLVEVHVSPDDGRALSVAALPQKSQVTSVRAKYYTAEAMDFGAPPKPSTIVTLSAR